jgi:hypothetical protein
MKETRLAQEKRTVARVFTHAHNAINLLTQWADRTVTDEMETADLIARTRACARALAQDLEPETVKDEVK